MKVLIVVSALLVAATAVPQWPFTYPWGIPGSRAWPYEVSSYGMPHHVTYALPSTVPLIMAKEAKSIDMPKPVEDTPEVKMAREAFLQEWEKQARAAALSPDISVSRKRRDVSPLVMPTSHLGGVPYSYSTIYGSHLYSPLSPYSGYHPLMQHINARVF